MIWRRPLSPSGLSQRDHGFRQRRVSIRSVGDRGNPEAKGIRPGEAGRGGNGRRGRADCRPCGGASRIAPAGQRKEARRVHREPWRCCTGRSRQGRDSAGQKAPWDNRDRSGRKGNRHRPERGLPARSRSSRSACSMSRELAVWPGFPWRGRPEQFGERPGRARTRRARRWHACWRRGTPPCTGRTPDVATCATWKRKSSPP